MWGRVRKLSPISHSLLTCRLCCSILWKDPCHSIVIHIYSARGWWYHLTNNPEINALRNKWGGITEVYSEYSMYEITIVPHQTFITALPLRNVNPKETLTYGRTLKKVVCYMEQSQSVVNSVIEWFVKMHPICNGFFLVICFYLWCA